MHDAPIVFDLDGTLIDSLEDIAAALNRVLARLHCSQHPVENIRTMVGGGASKLLERGLGPGNGHKLEEAMAHFQEEYGAHLLNHTRLYPGMESVLTALRAKGMTWAIATNKPAIFTKPLVDGLDLHRFGLSSWASGDEVPAKKPAPDVVRLAAERGGFSSTEPSAFTYVGDMPVDVACGRRFGCPTVGVTWGFDAAGVVQAGPDFVAETPAALLAHLTNRNQNTRPRR